MVQFRSLLIHINEKKRNNKKIGGIGGLNGLEPFLKNIQTFSKF